MAGTHTDLSVDLNGLTLSNPIITASGTTGYGPEYRPYVDLQKLGGFTTKSITLEPREGNPPPRTVETRAGLLNSIGLANVGLEKFISEKMPVIRKIGIPIFVNVAGTNIKEYCKVAEALDAQDGISGLEINISCPNVSSGGIEFGTNPEQAKALVAEVRKVVKNCKLIVKLSPNVTDISEIASAAVDGGAEILSLINTLRGMKIDIDTQKCILPRGFGGLSGPAIRPVAVYCIWKVYNEVAKKNNIPIIGMGGVQFASDAIELILAGASSVAVGTAMYVNEQAPIEIIAGIRKYCVKNNISRVSDLIGAVN